MGGGGERITWEQVHGGFSPNICSGAGVDTLYPKPVATVGLGVLVPGKPKVAPDPKQKFPGAAPTSHLQRGTQGGGGGPIKQQLL